MQSTAEDNIEHLLMAISFNEYERFNALLDKVGVNSKDENGQTALHRASSCGRVEYVKRLLEKKADVNIAYIDGNTALHYAVLLNKPEIVEILIKAKANPDLKNCKGETPDQIAARVGNEETQIAFPKNSLFKKIIEASDQNNVDKINDLIKENPGIDLNAIVTTGKWSSEGFGIIRTVMAAKSNIDCIKSIEALIKNGAKVDLPDKDGITPLLQASYYGDVNLVKFLLKNGANIDLADNEGNTALHYASIQGKSEVAKLLLNEGADPNSVNKNGDTCLANAIIIRFAGTDKIDNFTLPLVKLIFSETKVKIDIDKPNDFGRTTLQKASTLNKVDVVEFLLAQGANANEVNKEDGNTALHCAAQRGNHEVVKLLLEKGALLDSVNKEEKTPLQIVFGEQAPRAEHLIIAKLLLEKGADLEKIDKQSKLYPLLKILTKFTDDEIKVVANNFEDFKTIYDTTLPLRNFKNSIPQSGKDTIGILGNDLMSMSLEHLLSKELKLRLGEELTSKLVKNLLEMHSTSTQAPAETLPSAQSSQADAVAKPQAHNDTGNAYELPTPLLNSSNNHQIPNQGEPSSNPAGCFSYIRIFANSIFGSNNPPRQ